MTVQVKICGLQDEASLRAALDGGAFMVGFVFYSLSKNKIAPEAAAPLAALVPSHVKKVGLFVDVSEDELKQVLAKVPLDLLQLHGNETPERVGELKRLTGLPAMKALRLKTHEQFAAIRAFEGVTDRFLFDSRIGNEPSGGPLNWAMLKDELKKLNFTRPWMLAGGLTAANLAEAVKLSGATAVDVSSGVESTPHQKCPEKIREFLTTAHGLA